MKDKSVGCEGDAHGQKTPLTSVFPQVKAFKWEECIPVDFTQDADVRQHFTYFLHGLLDYIANYLIMDVEHRNS